MEWFLSLSVYEQIYFWIGVVATVFMIIQIIMLCFSSFGGDVDLDGDGDIDIDTDSGVSIFTVKSLTAFFAIGGWSGLLTCQLASDKLQWLSIIIAVVCGAAAMAVVVLIYHFIKKLQCSGTLETSKLVGKSATVYVTVPSQRSGRGKIVMTAQGKYLEMDAMTDGDKLADDESVEIISIVEDCAIVKRTENKVNN